MLTFLYLLICFLSNAIEVDYKILAVTAVLDGLGILASGWKRK